MAEEESSLHWYAVKTRNEISVEQFLSAERIDVYMPRMEVRTADNSTHTATRLVTPRLLLIHTDEQTALRLEKQSRTDASRLAPIWIYRFPGSERIQPIGETEFRLFKLLTSDDPATQCEIYRKTDFQIGQKVRITGGPFTGLTGYTRRIRRNKHVVVEIEGLCAIALPFIHPSLLLPLN